MRLLYTASLVIMLIDILTKSPIKNAVILCNGKQNPYISKDDGYYVFCNLYPGEYKISVAASGYINKEFDASIEFGESKKFIIFLSFQSTNPRLLNVPRIEFVIKKNKEFLKNQEIRFISKTPEMIKMIQKIKKGDQEVILNVPENNFFIFQNFIYSVKYEKKEEKGTKDKKDGKKSEDTEDSDDLDDEIAKLEAELNADNGDKDEESGDNLDDEIAKLEAELNSDNENKEDEESKKDEEKNEEEDNLDDEIAKLEAELNSDNKEKENEEGEKDEEKNEEEDNLDDEIANLEAELDSDNKEKENKEGEKDEEKTEGEDNLDDEIANLEAELDSDNKEKEDEESKKDEEKTKEEDNLDDEIAKLEAELNDLDSDDSEDKKDEKKETNKENNKGENKEKEGENPEEEKLIKNILFIGYDRQTNAYILDKEADVDIPTGGSFYPCWNLQTDSKGKVVIPFSQKLINSGFIIFEISFDNYMKKRKVNLKKMDLNRKILTIRIYIKDKD